MFLMCTGTVKYAVDNREFTVQVSEHPELVSNLFGEIRRKRAFAGTDN